MIVLKNTNLIQFYPPKIYYNVDVIIENEIIIDTGRNVGDNYKSDKTLNLNNKFISTGLVCSHNHFYSVLARGILADINTCNNFLDILKNLWWKLDRAIDEESLYYSGIIGALEAIKSGTTSVIDHNASPNFISGSLSTLKKAFETAGLRGILAYEITDRNGIDGMIEGVKESIKFAENIENDKRDLIETAIGAHAPFTLSDNSLEQIREAIKTTNRGLHIHVSEDETDPSYSNQQFGKDVLKRLDNFSLLNNKSIIAHGVYLTENDINILNERDSFLVHNPRSNMNNGVGYMNNLYKIKNVGIGTDGISSNMFEEIKFAFFKNNDSNGKLNMNDFMKFLQNGNVILERYFDNKFGKIEKGYIADIVIYDYIPPTNLVDENLAGHFIYGFSSRDVETVIINGNIVYENRSFPFETNSIYSKARAVANKMWERMNQIK
ncbi:MAG: putative aminohydrolase SsnA [Bacteroidetes bacterium]|nr:putative aminohydrolase SsnA [Bacteroidota bacterium]MCH8941176.1 putative aminohydrolase SsnA [Bacteroidota bacterium]